MQPLYARVRMREKAQTFVGAEPKQTSELAIPLYRLSVPQNVPDLVPVYPFC
jgi:hypothetical protein